MKIKNMKYLALTLCCLFFSCGVNSTTECPCIVTGSKLDNSNGYEITVQGKLYQNRTNINNSFSFHTKYKYQIGDTIK